MSGKIMGTTVTMSAGERLSFRGNDMNEVYVVLKGKVKAMTSYGNYILAPGSCVGFVDYYYGMCIYNYFIEEDATLRKYTISSVSDIGEVLKEQVNNLSIEVIMLSRFMGELCKTYVDLLAKCQKKDSNYTPDSRITSWEVDKYTALPTIPSNTSMDFLKANMSVAIGSFYEGLRFISSINDACIQMADMLSINLDYEDEKEEYIVALEETPDVFVGEDDSDSETILAQLDKSLAKILSFAEYDEDEAMAYTQLIVEYRNPKIQTSISDDARQLRREITKGFYKLYEACFFKAVNAVSIPPIITMFLNFGYLDENFLTQEQLVDLYKLATTLDALFTDSQVFTIYTWLREIYWGDKEPSRNTMDMEYAEYINSEQKMGSMTSAEAAEALKSTAFKVSYEIENLFQTANRVVFGRSTSFCPILTSGNASRSFSSLIMSSDKVRTALDAVRRVDYSAFYRDVLYVNKDAGIEKAYISQEVLPNIILMPTSGTDGTMWQDIEGRVRTSSARFAMPIFPSVNQQIIMTQLVGRFRWELCKRMQGSRWNMVSEPSLTSEYCDYIQFYKKNRDLTEAAKEKLKSTLSSCRNNYREVFVKDYETWMLYETTGSFRLNKVSRRIIYKYCPFVTALKNHLAENPMFAELTKMPDKDHALKVRQIDTIIASLNKKGTPIPYEIQEYKAFLSK